MAKSTGIILTATGIRIGNVWANTDQLDFRAGIAGLGAAFVLALLEKADEEFAVGLAVITLITSLFIPAKGKGTTPAETVLRYLPAK